VQFYAIHFPVLIICQTQFQENGYPYNTVGQFSR